MCAELGRRRNACPEAIGAAAAPGSIGVVVLDRAEWHQQLRPRAARNLALPELPPDSLELNPMETVFQYPKGNRLANRAFADAAGVDEACRKT